MDYHHTVQLLLDKRESLRQEQLLERHIDTNVLGADVAAGAVADEADVDVDGIALCSPASLLSTPGSLPSLTTPGRAGETPRPSCLVSPGGGAAQPSLLD